MKGRLSWRPRYTPGGFASYSFKDPGWVLAGFPCLVAGFEFFCGRF